MNDIVEIHGIGRVDLFKRGTSVTATWPPPAELEFQGFVYRRLSYSVAPRAIALALNLNRRAEYQCVAARVDPSDTRQ